MFHNRKPLTNNRHRLLIAMTIVFALAASSHDADARLANAAEKSDWPRVAALLKDRADANAGQPARQGKTQRRPGSFLRTHIKGAI